MKALDLRLELRKAETDHRHLESRLVALHRERRLADGLRGKYREQLARDAKQVDEIRADRRSEVQANLTRT